MSFFFQNKTNTPRLPNENKIIDLTSIPYQSNVLVCEDCGILLLYYANHPEASETNHFYICPKCSQTILTDDDPIKKGSLATMAEDFGTVSFNVIEDEPPEVQISKRMKYGRREERSTEIL